MGLYFSKSLGGGFRIGTRIGGNSKHGGCFIVSLIQGIIALLAIALFIVYWQVGILLLFIWFIICIFWCNFEENRKNLVQAEGMCLKLQRHIDLVHDSKTLSARLNNCNKSVSLLKEIMLLDPKGKVLLNATDMLNYLSSLERVMPVGDIIEKAERAEFKGQNKRALNYYLDAIFHCQKNNLSDNDFINADIRDVDSDDVISLDYLTEKARYNGWVG